MQEGSLSLMQMSKMKISLNKVILCIDPSYYYTTTTGGVTASFGMFGDIIISEPNAYIAFSGN